MKSLVFLEKDLEIFTSYKFYLDSIFREIDSEIKDIEILRSRECVNFHSGNLIGILKECSLEKINEYFDFKIIVVLNNLLHSNNKVVIKCLREIENLIVSYRHIFTEYNISTEINETTLLKNKNLLKMIIDFLEFEISRAKEKRNKK